MLNTYTQLAPDTVIPDGTTAPLSVSVPTASTQHAPHTHSASNAMIDTAPDSSYAPLNPRRPVYSSGRNVPASLPTAPSPRSQDFSFSLESRRRATDILMEGKKDYSMVLYGGIAHGFATRGDPSVPTQRWGKEHAALSALAWFDHHGSIVGST
ncbi:uncharacterized protein BXZ73DRAFT_103944 [Epithele typhae]|uniref:uncharacterized protein n=1 Tax=Epithele typhae TaxID=378194 RepID=UPI002008E433|nr:uncharacterized protein BXZ73DRAFT_103944 [Epithele typhae]KAH9923148.1 hypothetical protein BXZ73DRAFT_103944 [Epithele typhae]